MKDLEFKMSMTERDQFLGEKRIEIPTFEANRDYWAEQANRNVNLSENQIAATSYFTL